MQLATRQSSVSGLGTSSILDRLIKEKFVKIISLRPYLRCFTHWVSAPSLSIVNFVKRFLDDHLGLLSCFFHFFRFLKLVVIKGSPHLIDVDSVFDPEIVINN